jgi:D-glycero-D-manno-heptose 1,7-bisphosphate phosphatase
MSGSANFDAIAFVFLDRDGVINRKQPEGHYVTRLAELELLPGAAEAIARLNRSGRKVIVVTNQRGISQGLMSEADLAAIHAHLRAELARSGAHLDAIFHCPHGRGECTCRKPATGMIEAAFRQFPTANSRNSILIGDTLADIQCGRAAGMPTIFIEGEPDHRKPGFETAAALADFTALDLVSAVDSKL